MVSIPLAALSVSNRVFGHSVPDIAVVKKTGSERLKVVGHTSPWARDFGGGGTGNLIVHFPDEESLRDLSFLRQGLTQSERADIATNIVCVVSHDDLTRVTSASGVTFADDTHGWERLLHVRERPATVVLGLTGDIVWQNQGVLTAAQLADALRAHLLPGGVFRPRLLKSHLRSGQTAPDFLIPTGEGEGITLRMLAGTRVVLVFWKSSSKPSLEILSELRKAFAEPGVQVPVLLAIRDGEDSAPENWFADHFVMVVPDPDRAIAAAYGVDIWPTVISLDESGSIMSLQSGLASADEERRRENENQHDPKHSN